MKKLITSKFEMSMLICLIVLFPLFFISSDISDNIIPEYLGTSSKYDLMISLRGLGLVGVGFIIGGLIGNLPVRQEQLKREQESRNDMFNECLELGKKTIINKYKAGLVTSEEADEWIKQSADECIYQQRIFYRPDLGDDAFQYQDKPFTDEEIEAFSKDVHEEYEKSLKLDYVKE